MKEKFQDMENCRKKSNRNPGNKKYLKSNKNTVESHSTRLEQMEDRISGLKDKIDSKGKKRILRQNTQKLQIMAIEDEEEPQTKVIQ
jgi:hypothetical protein